MVLVLTVVAVYVGVGHSGLARGGVGCTHWCIEEGGEEQQYGDVS